MFRQFMNSQLEIMNDKLKNKIVPQLRFSEFVEDGEWKEKTLGDVCEMQAGKFVRASEIKEKLSVGLFPCYGGNGLRGYIKSNTHEGQFSLIGRQGALCGNVTLTDGIFHATEHAVVVTPKKNIETLWLFYELKLLNLNQYATGQAQPGLSVSNLVKVEVNIPTLPEQQKIANCLTSLDHLITAETEKLAHFKEHKKGLLQQLFPAKGATKPQFRFAEFEGDGDWEVKTFEELFTIGNGRDYKHLSEGNVPVYGSGGYMRSVNEYLYDGESVCIGRKGTINKPIFLTGKFWTVDTLFYTHSFKDCIPQFVYLIFQKVNWLKHNEAGGVPSLSKTNLYKINVQIPLPSEQVKIVHCFNKIDGLIEAQKVKIKTLKKHKKGLMQQLFPSIKQ